MQCKHAVQAAILTVLLAAGLLLGAARAQPSAVAGEVVFVAGAASRQADGAASEPIVKGQRLAQGDLVRTEDQAYVYVRMADGGLLVMRPQSRLHIDLWRYDPQHPEQSEIKYTLSAGVARYVSGRGSYAAKDKFRFNTSLAAIGVRGTDFTVLARPDLTQVSVKSGGVVVGSLGNGCKAEALGPCEGDRVLELFASSSNKLLQVAPGDRRPLLVDAATAGSPDKARPPANGEPHADGGASLPAGVLATESARAATVTELAGKSAGTEPPAPQPLLPLSIATWGRWGALAQGNADVSVVQDVLKNRALAAINRYYVIGANPGSVMEMPNAGVGQFKLVGHDGFLVEPGTGQIQATAAANGMLQIDFGARRFQTSLELQSPTLQTGIQSQGYIETSGKMASDPFVSPTLVEGLVGGKGTGEAIYTYHRAPGNGIEVSGVASWRK